MRVHDDATEAEITKAYLSGVKSKELAKKYYITQRTVTNIIKRNGGYAFPKRMTLPEIDYAIDRYEAGWTGREIGKSLGFSETCIYKVLAKNGVTLRSNRRVKGWNKREKKQ